MGGVRNLARWVLLAGAVVATVVMVGPSIASGSVSGGITAFPPPNSCAAPVLPCYILLSLASGSHGNNETVTGARFWPGDLFTVYFWNGSAAAGAAAVASGFTGTGSFSASFHVPKDPVGNYTIFVTDLAGDNQSASFHLTYLIAHPNTGPVGNTTSLSGQGFLPDHVVKFHLHGVRASTSVRCKTDSHGNFSGCLVTVPSVPSGKALLTATDGTYIARIQFVVS